MAGITPHGIHYPDGASKAKNLGPELATMANDIDDHIDSYLDPEGPLRPIVEDIAEDVVAAEVEEIGAVVGIPTEETPLSGRTSLPISWTHRTLSDPWTDTYADVEQGTWNNQGRYQRDVPLLNNAGYVPDEHISPSVARLSDIPAPEPAPTGEHTRRLVAGGMPILAGRIEAARFRGDPVSIVFAGSSTTAAMPGYVQDLSDLVQDVWPEGSQTGVIKDQTGAFTPPTPAGIHGFNVGIGGTRTDDYLTDAMCDNLAALDPALIIHMVGGSNDYTAQYDPAIVQANLESRLAYLDSVLTLPCQHVLVMQYAKQNFTPPTYQHGEYLAALEAVAAGRTLDTVVIDLSSDYRAMGIPGADPLGLISVDDTHQTNAGYAVMATRIAARIVQ